MTDAEQIAQVHGHVADALEPQARDLGVEIETDFPDEPVAVCGDRDELIQVFENLIENACKYGQSGKRVTVTVGWTNPGGVAARPVILVALLASRTGGADK